MDVAAALDAITTSQVTQQQEDMKKELAAYLNRLILDDFPALVQKLYRVDVSEQKLKAVLQENPSANAGDLLAELLVQRQREKVLARQTFTSSNDDLPEDEAW